MACVSTYFTLDLWFIRCKDKCLWLNFQRYRGRFPIGPSREDIGAFWGRHKGNSSWKVLETLHTFFTIFPYLKSLNHNDQSFLCKDGVFWRIYREISGNPALFNDFWPYKIRNLCLLGRTLKRFRQGYGTFWENSGNIVLFHDFCWL